MYIAIVKTENNRVAVYQPFDNAEDAQTHCAEYGGFVYPGAYSPDLFIAEDNSVSIQKPQLPREVIIATLTNAVQQRMDSFAQSRNYDNILSACTYADSTIPDFSVEGQYCRKMRDSTWEACYAIMADVEAGKRPIPTVDELLAELPPLDWPTM